jgi:uncharacterized protein (UPF0261 family)
MARSIVILATLDTKSEEAEYLKDFIERKGHKAVVIDAGVLGKPQFQPDFSNEAVAEAGGKSLQDIIKQGDEAKGIDIMSKGALKICLDLHSLGRLDGMIGIGGSMGTGLCLPVMKGLPLGIPKFMVSTMAFTPFVSMDLVSLDQIMLQPVVDLWGLNVITRHYLKMAAAAIVGMAEVYEKIALDKFLISITTRGERACKYSTWIKPELEKKGYEVAVFHSNGLGGRTYENLIRQGIVKAALDLSPCEVMDELCGGTSSAGPDRLEAASAMGIPQVVSCGCMDFWAWNGPKETLPLKYQDRITHAHNSLAMLVKTSPEEMAAIGREMARKLNVSKGPVTVLIPSQGFSGFDKPGDIFYEPEGRIVFAEALKEAIDPKIEVRELDLHINDLAFAHEVVAALDSLM